MRDAVWRGQLKQRASYGTIATWPDHSGRM